MSILSRDQERDLALEIERRQTYHCPNCGDFKYYHEEYRGKVFCPKCGSPAERPNVTSRKTSIIGYVYSKIPLFLIHRIKAPLKKAILDAASKLDFDITKENTKQHNVHILIDTEQKFWKYYQNPELRPLFLALWKQFEFEIETDRHYRSIFYFLVEEIVKEVLKGNWQFRKWHEHELEWEYWTEPQENIDELPDMLFRLFEVEGRI